MKDRERFLKRGRFDNIAKLFALLYVKISKIRYDMIWYHTILYRNEDSFKILSGPAISLDDHFLVQSGWTSFPVPLNFTLSFCQRTTLLDDFSLSKLLNSHVTGHWVLLGSQRMGSPAPSFPFFFPVLFTRGQIASQPVTPKSCWSTKVFKILWGFPYTPPWHQVVMLAWTGWVVLKATGMVRVKLP